MGLAEIWVMPNSSYVTTKQEQVSEDLFCIQSKGLSVTKIYARVEELDIITSFYLLLMGKRTKICTCVHVEGAQFLVFSTWEKAGKAGLLGPPLFSWGKSLAAMRTRWKLLLLNAVEIRIDSLALSVWEPNQQ